MDQQKVAVFMHVAILGRYQEVFDEVLTALLSSPLAKNVNDIFVHVVGEGVLTLKFSDNRIQVIRHPVGIEAFEYLTLEAMQTFGKSNPSAYILYLNCLGGRHVGPGWSIRQEWRKLLYYLYLERYEHCFNALKTHDVVGVDWSLEPFPHMTSNNYWATGAHFAALPKIEDCGKIVVAKDLSKYGESWKNAAQKKRHAGEFWIGMRDGVKAFSLFPLQKLGLPTGEFNNVPWWGLPNIQWEYVAKARMENQVYTLKMLYFIFQMLGYQFRFLLKKLKSQFKKISF